MVTLKSGLAGEALGIAKHDPIRLRSDPPAIAVDGSGDLAYPPLLRLSQGIAPDAVLTSAEVTFRCPASGAWLPDSVPVWLPIFILQF